MNIALDLKVNNTHTNPSHVVHLFGQVLEACWHGLAGALIPHKLLCHPGVVLSEEGQHQEGSQQRGLHHLTPYRLWLTPRLPVVLQGRLQCVICILHNYNTNSCFATCNLRWRENNGRRWQEMQYWGRKRGWRQSLKGEELIIQKSSSFYIV